MKHNGARLQKLLQLYPYDYKVWFAAEMLTAFEELVEARRGRGSAAQVRFAIAELMGLLIGASSEWIAKLTSDRSVRARLLPDWRMIRPTGVTRDRFFRVCSSDTWR